MGEGVEVSEAHAQSQIIFGNFSEYPNCGYTFCGYKVAKRITSRRENGCVALPS